MRHLNGWPAEPNWANYSYFTLLTLKNGTDHNSVQPKDKKHHSQDIPVQKSWKQHLLVYPLEKYHLYGHFTNGVPGRRPDRTGAAFSLYSALGILAIACINFMNLSTARSQKRAKK